MRDCSDCMIYKHENENEKGDDINDVELKKKNIQAPLYYFH